MHYVLLLSLIVFTKSLNLPKTWNKITLPFKEKARNWFINRAEDSGIEWTNLRDYYQSPEIYTQLIANKIKLNDNNLTYPSYYTKPFHGYDAGNLNWLAAQEAEAATLNIASGYWPEVNVNEAQKWMRTNTTNLIKDYLIGYCHNFNYNHYLSDYCNPNTIIDVGCSVGISTEHIKNVFPKSNIFGLDLSPYFLSVAELRNQKNNLNITYIHANAEKISFQDNTINLITCNYLFHEVPLNATVNILKEIYRILTNGGVIAIADIEPDSVNKNKNNFLTPFRKWMFEVTEPHIFSYYENPMIDILSQVGFTNIIKAKNDPVNSVWVAQKIIQ